MKRIALLFTAVIALAVIAFAVIGVLPGNSVSAEEANLRVATLDVEGMTCGGCAISVKAVVKRIDGVTDADVSWEEGRAVVTYEAGKVEPEQIAKTIEEKLSYKAKVLEDKAKG